MALRVNANGVMNTLNERLASDSEVLKSAAELFAFYAVASSGEHLAFAAGVALITKAAGAALKGGTELAKRLFAGREEDTGEDELPVYERFQAIFYTLVLNAYLNALREKLGDLKPPDMPKGQKAKGKTPPPEDLLASLNLCLTSVNESEVPFLLGVDPLAGDVPFYGALTNWMTTLLSHYGFPEYQSRPVLAMIVENAKQRFHVFIATEDTEALWIRNYLLLSHQSKAERIASDLTSVTKALEDWIKDSAPPRERQLEAWDAYRETLLQLPDNKDSMYNEQFGVRDVFVRPQGTYAVTGASGEAGKPQTVSDLGSVLGGLLSTRVSGNDLILLCGGPGSGKSTLCRVLASELASDLDVYPIFVRLRRLKEGSDIPAFLETELSRIGIVDRIADLRTLKNVVLILDGFDELVMASRARLRHFFNALKEDHLNGALHGMRIIVSGRDTLFPNGEGLPLGCHVLTLRPFDRARVALWGKKWRACHLTGGGSTFRPELLLPPEKSNKTSALQHLVTWPLTLHLVARVHTSGRMQVDKEGSDSITKAVLYRSILMETSTRQREQTDGSGRLEPKAMREFLRALAWKMYEDGTDSMDPSEVLPILKSFFPNTTETDLAELAEVAVVNSPEITKGEQTGFEFVHKSFAEYLTAERIAITIERVTFEAPEFDSDVLSFRMSDSEAANTIAEFLAFRLLTEEIQEMLDPMLGDFKGFSSGGNTNSVDRIDGLGRIKKRFQSLLDSVLRGSLVTQLDEHNERARKAKSPYEIQANFAAGIVLIGSAAVLQIQKYFRAPTNDVEGLFAVQSFEGAFWRLLSLLQAGGILVNEHITARIFSGCSVLKDGKNILDLDQPIKIAWLQDLDGFRSIISEAVHEQQAHLADMAITLEISIVLISVLLPSSDREVDLNRDLMHMLESIRHESFALHGWRRSYDYPNLFEVLARGGLIPSEILQEHAFMHEEFLRSMGPASETSEWLNNLSYSLERLGYRGSRKRGFGSYSRVLRPLLSRIADSSRSSHASGHLIERMAHILKNF